MSKELFTIILLLKHLQDLKEKKLFQNAIFGALERYMSFCTDGYIGWGKTLKKIMLYLRKYQMVDIYYEFWTEIVYFKDEILGYDWMKKLRVNNGRIYLNEKKIDEFLKNNLSKNQYERIKDIDVWIFIKRYKRFVKFED